VESSTRPDGARASGEFFHVLHAGQESVALDFGSPGGRAALRRLLNAADVVIESSRPRALRQLGIERDEVLRHGRPRLWISITGYGGAGDAANSVAFGDDAAVAGGLVAWDGGRPCFCADAVADPATGLVAAAAAFAAWRAGRWKLDIALARVAAALAPDRNDWRARSPREAIAPRARTAHGRAPDLGHDTHRILEEIGGDRTAEPHALAIDA
jgi:crotonobetainyl-CoA:carnitine CoA-transferase CaiB-like acyl-CoA transferase